MCIRDRGPLSKAQLLQKVHDSGGSLHRAWRDMLKTLQLQGFKWPHMKRDVRDFVCTPCERAYKLRSSNMEPYCDPWDTSTLTAQWGVDLFFLPDEVTIVNARSRSSKHWRALLTTTRCTARDVLAFLRDEVVDSPFFDVKACLLYTSPSPRDATLSRMPSSA